MGVGRGSTQQTAIGHVLCALKSSNRADMVHPQGAQSGGIDIPTDTTCVQCSTRMQKLHS